MLTGGYGASISQLYEDKATITHETKEKDATTKVTRFVSAVKYSNVPCRLSFSTISSANGDTVAKTGQSVKLFLSPIYDVPAGCMVSIVRSGKTLRFKSSGSPAVYDEHQEIMLESLEEYA